MTPEEKSLSIKNMEAHKEKLRFLEYFIKEKTMYLDEGLEIMMAQKKSELKGQIKEAKSEIETLKFAIKATEKKLSEQESE